MALEFRFIEGSCASQMRSEGSVTFYRCLLPSWTPALLCGTLALPHPHNTRAHLSCSSVLVSSPIKWVHWLYGGSSLVSWPPGLSKGARDSVNDLATHL